MNPEDNYRTLLTRMNIWVMQGEMICVTAGRDIEGHEWGPNKPPPTPDQALFHELSALVNLAREIVTNRKAGI